MKKLLLMPVTPATASAVIATAFAILWILVRALTYVPESPAPTVVQTVLAGQINQSAAVVSCIGHGCPGDIKLRPEHLAILKKTGWLSYVTENIQELRYVDDFHGLSLGSDNDFVGLAQIRDERRIALVTTKDQTVVEVVRTIIHEATHLKGYREHGYQSSQEDARAAEERFQDDYNRTYPHKEVADPPQKCKTDDELKAEGVYSLLSVSSSDDWNIRKCDPATHVLVIDMEATKKFAADMEAREKARTDLIMAARSRLLTAEETKELLERGTWIFGSVYPGLHTSPGEVELQKEFDELLLQQFRFKAALGMVKE